VPGRDGGSQTRVRQGVRNTIAAVQQRPGETKTGE